MIISSMPFLKSWASAWLGFVVAHDRMASPTLTPALSGPTVKIVSKFTSFYRFIVLNLSFYRCRLQNQSFFPFIVLSFFGKKHSVYSIVLSFYRCKENIEFFYRFIVLSFYLFIVVNLSFYRCRPIVLSLRFIVVDVNLETILTV